LTCDVRRLRLTCGPYYRKLSRTNKELEEELALRSREPEARITSLETELSRLRNRELELENELTDVRAKSLDQSGHY
jgi:predicted RNase H-like nuclease (RuvC/YqgF family)